ncbi:MAG TPA: outer membrane beta-barrel family protein, partial [Chitinophagaceae bacterium]|nr:outer membrane beta-barrel family protein [Chitinophagaceae bacterium]
VEDTRPGTYILRFSSAGYQTWDSPVFELTDSQQNKNFGTQIMKKDTKQLGEVVIRSEKPLYQQRPEGLLINVESSILTKGSSALEVLERSPGVVIDHRNNSIALNGKAGVMVMLNGKLMRMSAEQVASLLNGMSADDIEKIELLTTPPTRYDAEGSAGLINIVLKKNKKLGTNGSVSVTGGYGWREKGTGSINLSNNTKNINIYGSYTFSHDRTYSDLFVSSAQNMPVLGGRIEALYQDTTNLVRDNHDATFGLDIKLSPKTIVGGSIAWNSSKASSTTFTHAGYNVLPDSLLLFNGERNGINRWKNLVSSVYLEKEIREGEKINVDIDWLYYKNNNPTDVQSSFLDKNGNKAGTNNDSLFAPRQRGFANTTIQVGVVKMDYTKQVSKKIKLETGVKWTYTESSSLAGIESLVNGLWIGRSETSNDIAMQENIGALYASVNTQISPSATLVIGARYEYAHTRMDNTKTRENIVDRKLGVLFPSIFFSKKLDDDAELQLSYTKRIGRPSYNDLASFVTYSDPTAVYTGNPLLKPTITNNIKLGYNYKGYTFSLLFSRDDYPIARYQLTQKPAGNLLYISPQNPAYQNNLTFQTNLPWKVNNWWNMSYGFVGGLRQFKLDHTIQRVKKTYFSYNLNFNQTFKLPKNFSVELSGWYSSLFYNGSVKLEGLGMLNAGIKKELKNSGGAFQLSVSDLIRTMRFKGSYGTLTEEVFSIKNHLIFYTESGRYSTIKFTYSRSFGNNKTKAQTQRSTGPADERDRIRKE